MTPDQRLARHMRVEVLGGTVLQIPSFDEAMAMIYTVEHRCRGGLLRDKPDAVRWFLGALREAQDWIDVQPLREAVGMRAVGHLCMRAQPPFTREPHATRFEWSSDSVGINARRGYPISSPPEVYVVAAAPYQPVQPPPEIAALLSWAA